MYYVLVVVLLLLFLYLRQRNEGLGFANTVLFPPMASVAASVLPAKKDIPVPPAVTYQPRTIAYPTYEDAHAHRLRDTVKRPDGMTLADTALEYKFLNPGV